VAAEPPAPTAEAAVLELPDDGFVTGRLAPAAAAGGPRTTFLWQSPRFSAPLDFSVAGFRRIRFAEAATAAPAAEQPLWRADLVGGDVVLGRLAAIDAEAVMVEVPGVAGGTLRLARGRLERLARVGGGARTLVPGRLADWRLTGAGFEERAGRIAVPAGGRAFRPVAAGRRAIFDIVLSWDARPEFELSFTATAEGKPADDWRLEAADGDLVAIREGRTARLAAVAAAPAGQGSMRIRCFVDRESGRMVVEFPAHDDDAKPAFDETVAPVRAAAAEPDAGGIAITVRQGALRIDSLRVDAWGDGLRTLTGQGPAGAGAVVESFAAETGEFVFRAEAGPKRVAAREITEIPFAPAAADRAEPPAAAVRLALHDGTWLTGRLLEVTDRSVRIDAVAAAAPVECELARLAAIEPAVAPRPDGLPARPGLLEGDGLRTLGCLVPGADGGGIAWLARGAAAAAPLDAAALSRGDHPLTVAYRGLTPAGDAGLAPVKRGGDWVVETVLPGGPAARDGRVRPGARISRIRPAGAAAPVDVADLDLEDVQSLLRGVVGGTLRLAVTGPDGPAEIDLVLDAAGRDETSPARPAPPLGRALDVQAARIEGAADGAAEPAGPAVVYLKTGDSIRCTAVAIEEGGLRIRTDRGEVVVPAVALRAVEFAASPSLAIPREKLVRLLTLPRMQAADPPPHLLRLETGDYLRGRAVALDDRGLRFDVLGTVKAFPRDAIARLIWLTVEGDDAEARAAAAVIDGGNAGGVPVRATMTDGRRLSLAATGVAGDRLLGTSAIFGPASVALARCERLELGLAKSDDTTPLPYSQWRLKPAPTPRALRKP
jgi:hypothetical protein